MLFFITSSLVHATDISCTNSFHPCENKTIRLPEDITLTIPKNSFVKYENILSNNHHHIEYNIDMDNSSSLHVFFQNRLNIVYPDDSEYEEIKINRIWRSYTTSQKCANKT